jgi:hypothetical protein
MMKNFAKAVRARFFGAMRRFIRNTPANNYEQITFDALRRALVTFGKATPA